MTKAQSHMGQQCMWKVGYHKQKKNEHQNTLGCEYNLHFQTPQCQCE